MKKTLFNMAIKNGEYIAIDEFDPGDGKKCGCICAECGEKLISNITAKKGWQLKRKFTNHFSHYDENSICKGGQGETEIHLYAKQLLVENNNLVVPVPGGVSKELPYKRAISEPAFPVEKYNQKRPDILIYDINEKATAIEIIVTNPVSDEKKSLYEEVQLRCLSINLSIYHNKDLNSIKDRLKSDILKGISRKEWIWTDEKAPEKEGLPEVSKEEEPHLETKETSSGINPVWIVVVASCVFFFRKSIMKFIKKVFNVR